MGVKTVLGEPMLHAFRDVSRNEQYVGKDSKVMYRWLDGENPVLS